ncbi:metallophosphoesterase family protein [Venenivibrio stagnispumantis]|uniref:Predicted phosphodiesterase n=1 Tax=Venenivibrio stagnispumantis TaxID=407998 RepID=A0AA46AFA9_9AQUI|nr:metallophosphoesterase family protein [Venenivibrio stagnispumantis]MCW4573260.1 metallophosphatase family protein [Venenivibrio stagnispumantis]SMP18227.1 Predicted phosphodiesterase [Venenivibrio stagnispumantis]
MRIAFISDIHSNIYALEAVSEDIKKQSIDKIICLGDIVGYGSHPNEVAQWVIQNCDISLRGNHDTLISEAEPIDMHNPYTLMAAFYNKEKLEEKYKEFLRNLEKDLENDIWVLTHDEPCIPGSMEYITKEKEASDTFSAFKQKFCFYGHTHLPLIFATENKDVKIYSSEEKIFIKEEERYLISVASVGQPRDKDKRAKYLIFDMDENYLQFRRVEYNREKAASDILAAGIPSLFAKILL